MSRSSVFEQNVAAPDRESGAPEPTGTAAPIGAAGPTGAAPPAGDPAAIGTPAFIVGAIALGITLTGLVPASTSGSAVPIIVTATAMGQTIAAVWAARLGQDAIATVFGVFSGFWWSYAALALGLMHGWYGVTSPAGVVATEKVFQISWLTVFVLLTLFSFRLPLAFTALFTLVDLSVLLVTVGIFTGSETWTQAGGWATFGFTAVGVYLFLHGLSTATGGREMPLGRPVLH